MSFNPTSPRPLRFALFGLTAGLLVAFGWSNRDEVLAILRSGDYHWLALGLGAYALAMISAIIGWHAICEWLDLSSGLMRDATFYTISTLAGRLPGGIWGLVSRTYLYRASQISTARSLGAWLVEQVVILFTAILCLPFWFALSSISDNPLVRFAAPGIIVLGLVVAGKTPQFLRRLPRFKRLASLELRSPPRDLALITMTAYALVWCLGGILLWSSVRVFAAISIDELPAVEVAWIASRGIATLFTILPATFGLPEAVLAFALTPVVPLAAAIPIALLARIVTTAGEALAATLCFALCGIDQRRLPEPVGSPPSNP